MVTSNRRRLRRVVQSDQRHGDAQTKYKEQAKKILDTNLLKRDTKGQQILFAAQVRRIDQWDPRWRENGNQVEEHEGSMAKTKQEQ